MKIGIDISQLAFPNTGVAIYLENLVLSLAKTKDYEFVLFFSSLRKSVPKSILEISKQENVTLKCVKIPPVALHVMWNVLHRVPIESFIGDVDLFITSDWAEAPAKKAKKATIIYDLIVYKFPEETHNITEYNMKKLIITPNIVNVQKKKLVHVKRESDIVFCISESSRKDAEEILEIDRNKIRVIYPGF